MIEDTIIAVKGAGDLGSGVILRLHRSGFRVIATEVEQPTTVRRTVSFSEAVYAGEYVVEGVRARRIAHIDEAACAWTQGVVAVVVDPESIMVKTLRPVVVVDAIMAKRNLGTHLGEAPVVVAIGPGFTAGVDAHAVVETQRGHHLGRVLWHGSAAPDTGIPGEIGGHSTERLLRAPCAGVLREGKLIGDHVEAGETICWVDGTPVSSSIAGVLRGVLHDGLPVYAGMKIGDVDPRATRDHCFSVSDKSLAIGGGVLEAVLHLLRRTRPQA